MWSMIWSQQSKLDAPQSIVQIFLQRIKINKRLPQKEARGHVKIKVCGNREREKKAGKEKLAGKDEKRVDWKKIKVVVRNQVRQGT